MSSSQAICWILDMYSSQDSSFLCFMSYTSSLRELCLPKRDKNDDFSCCRVVLADSGNERYHCWAISVRWNTILPRICCSLKECSAHHCTNKVHHCVALIFPVLPENFGRWTLFSVLNILLGFTRALTIDELLEFVVLVCDEL